MNIKKFLYNNLASCDNCCYWFAVRRNHVCLFTDHVVTTANHRRLLVVLWRWVCRMTSLR